MTLLHCAFLAFLAVPTGVVAARAVEHSRNRAAWAALAVSLALYTGGFAWQGLSALAGETPSFPGPADILWLAEYPFALAALFLFARPWLRRLSRTLVLETLLVLLATMAVVTALVLPPLQGNTSGLAALAQVVNFLYPLFDSLLLSAAIIGAGVAGPRHAAPWLLIGVGSLGFVAGDLLWTVDVADGKWTALSAGYLPYAVWPLAVAGAARLPLDGTSRFPAGAGMQAVVTTLAATTAAIGLLALNEWIDVPATSVILAALALLTASHRGALALAGALQGNLAAARERELVDDVREALANQDLTLHYQPLVDARNGTVRGAEALIRWYRNGSFVAPDAFLPAVERSELMRSVTDFVLDRALETAARWWAEGYRIGISVNLATANLSEADLPGRVLQALCHHRLPAQALTLEITETAEIHDNVMAQHVLKALHQLGVCLSVDDFGTGHSSLIRLAHFPISELKIDRSFVEEMHTSKQPIVATAIQIAQTLSLRVVAEGIEDQETLDALRALGCDHAQGYFISRPLPAQEFEGWLYQNAIPRAVPATAPASPLTA